MKPPLKLDEQPIAYESRALRFMRRRTEDIELDRQLARIAIEVGADLPEAPSAPRAAHRLDENERLRGIPVVGVKGGLGGAITGTRPGAH